MDTPAWGLGASFDAMSGSTATPDAVDRPRCLWMASTDYLYWGAPRRVCLQGLLTGPDPRRQYLLVTVEPPASEPDPDHPTPHAVVLTPRHQYEITKPEPGRPLRLHLWVVNPATDIVDGVFEPPRPQSDGWVELWASYEEAERNGAKPW